MAKPQKNKGGRPPKCATIRLQHMIGVRVNSSDKDQHNAAMAVDDKQELPQRLRKAVVREIERFLSRKRK